MRAWQRWQEAQSTLQRKREAEAKLLWANKPDKLQQAKEDITEVGPGPGAWSAQMIARAFNRQLWILVDVGFQWKDFIWYHAMSKFTLL